MVGSTQFRNWENENCNVFPHVQWCTWRIMSAERLLPSLSSEGSGVCSKLLTSQQIHNSPVSETLHPRQEATISAKSNKE